MLTRTFERNTAFRERLVQKNINAERRQQRHHCLGPAVLMTVHSDGDTDYIAHLFDGIADSSEASAEPLKLTTYNSCLETVDGCRRRIRSAPR